jgi:hypothetical protein
VLTVTKVEQRQRRPACGQCSGTGYVYLWAVAKAGPRTWFCDRCKRSWSDGDSSLALLIGDHVGVQPVVPVLANREHEPLEPAADGGGADQPDPPRPRRLRVIEPNAVRVARGARVGDEPITERVDDAQSSASSAPAARETLRL